MFNEPRTCEESHVYFCFDAAVGKGLIKTLHVLSKSKPAKEDWCNKSLKCVYLQVAMAAPGFCARNF